MTQKLPDNDVGVVSYTCSIPFHSAAGSRNIDCGFALLDGTENVMNWK